MAKRVLVVDDSNLMRHCIVACLAGAGHSVVGKARDGGEAVALYRELLPDVVTMDVTMRGKDGIAAAREILDFDPGASIVFYTLLDEPGIAKHLKELPVRNVIRKGDEVELLRALEAKT